MYFAFLDILDAVNTFMQRGGPVLWVIAWLLLIKWSLVFERVWYLNTTHKKNVKNTLADWNARKDTKSWSAHQIRTMMISKISLDVRNTLPIIEVLVTICPLLGLIGTVTGMGYNMANIVIFVILQPALILLFFILWRREKKKNRNK